MSDLKTIIMSEATAAELRWFGTNVMGLELSSKDGADRLRAKLREAGWTKDTIQMAETPDPEPVVEGEGDSTETMSDAAQERRSEVSGEKDPKVRIFIPKQDGVGGDQPVPVGVNGTMILIPREEECDVAVRYVRVLQNAIRTEYGQSDHGELYSRNVPQYPFNIIAGRENLEAA